MTGKKLGFTVIEVLLVVCVVILGINIYFMKQKGLL